MSNLTNEEIRKVHAMYWGQYIIKVMLASWDGEPLREIDILTMESDSFKYFKLSLTSLKLITDEHAIRLAELINCSKYAADETFKVVKEDERISVHSSEVKHETIPIFGYRYETRIYTDCYVSGIGMYSLTKQMPYEAYQQLINWGYSVPLYFGLDHWANGKTAIELGIAIDKSKQ
jgi:hypothetical protein